MKKISIAIAIPSPDRVPVEFAFDSLPGIISYTKNNLKQLGDLFITYQVGVRTDKNRNIMLKKIIERGGVDYVLWLDSDMIYPDDIICRYMEVDFDVIGCLYFKRPKPHDPVAFVNNPNNPKKPYYAIHPSNIKMGKWYPVDAIGYGGMMVSMKVYEKLEDKKWTKYGKNYHLPYSAEDNLTHDLIFCRDVKKAGFSIKLHGSIRPAHLGVKAITEELFYFYHQKPEEKEVKVKIK